MVEDFHYFGHYIVLYSIIEYINEKKNRICHPDEWQPGPCPSL